MMKHKENCLHLEGLEVLMGEKFGCPICRAELDIGGVREWVLEAERARDETYSSVKSKSDSQGQGREERQREVYRRRGILYDLLNLPQVVSAYPEMMLVTYNPLTDSYDCRIFYKGPKPARSSERFSVEARSDSILSARSHPDPNVRLVAGKIEEFHSVRSHQQGAGEAIPYRRVYYAGEL